MDAQFLAEVIGQDMVKAQNNMVDKFIDIKLRYERPAAPRCDP